ncbi:MAG: AsmA-like C-terminal domain-containing protein [Nitrospiraceae bacterium]
MVRRVIRNGFIGLVILLVLAVGGLLLARPLTGHDYIQDFFLYQIEQNIGRKVDVRVARLVVFPSIRLELKDAVVYEPDGTTVFVKADRIDTVLRLWPLFQRKVVGKRLLVEKPTIELRRDRNGAWNVTTMATSGSGSTGPSHRPSDWLMFMKETTLEDGTIRVTDDARPDGTRTMTFTQVNTKVTVDAIRERGEVSINALVPGEGKSASLSLAGAVVPVAHPARFSTDDPSKLDTVLQFDGTFDASQVSVRRVADMLGPRPIPAELLGALTLKGDVHVVPGAVGYDLVFQSVTGQLEKLAVTARANLSGLLSAQPALAVTFSSSPVSVDELLTYLPAKWIHPALPGVIAERQISGTVEVVTATISASTEPRPQYGITGEFRVANGRALLGTDLVVTKNLAGTVFVEPGRLRIPTFIGDYGTMHIGHGKLLVSFLDAGPWLELDLTGDMTVANLLKYLATSIQSPSVSNFLGSIRNIQGVAVPTFRLVGGLNQPGGVTFVGGEVEAENVSFDTTALPGRVTGVQGRLKFSQAGTTCEDIIGHIGPSRFRLNGTVLSGRPGAFEDFTAYADGETTELVKFLPATAAATVTSFVHGPVALSLVLSGAADRPQLRAQATLTDATVLVPGVGEKPASAPAQLEARGELTANGVVITQVDTVLTPLRLALKGKMTLGERFAIDASLGTGTVSLSSLPEWINRGGLEAGNLEVSLDVKGVDPHWSTWSTTGWVALTNGMLTAKGLDGPVHDIYLRMKLVRNGAELKQLSVKLLDSDVTASGTLRTGEGKPSATLKLESNKFDIALLIPKEGRSPVRDFLEWAADKTQVSATATIEDGRYKKLRFAGLSARIAIEDGAIDIDRLAGRLGPGHVAGRLVVQLPKEQPAEAEATVRLSGVPFEELATLAGTTDPLLSGDVRLTATIRGHGRNPHGLYPSLSGDAEMVVTDGRLFRSQKRTIWKILGILNLPAVLQGQIDLEKNGLPFEKITGSFVMRNGLLEAQKIAIDSPVIKLSGAGNYDLPTDQLDMVYAVSPFGSYSKFIQNVPLFGRFFAGERTGIITAFFQVKGSVEDPEVTYMPMKSFAQGLSSLATLAFDVLRNTFRMPSDLLSGDSGKSDGTPRAPDASESDPGGRLY